MSEQPLTGERILVTRMSGQGGRLRRELQALGADVVAVPTIAIADPTDAGRSLGELLDSVEDADWVVFTSPNGVDRFVAAVEDRGTPFAERAAGMRIAAVGPGTRDRLAAKNVDVDLMPTRAIAESLVEDFPAGSGLVLLPQAEVARPTVAEGLRALGWTVKTAAAYRTIDATITEEQIAAVSDCTVATFTSGSTVDRFVRLIGASALPPKVACIGPITAASAAAHDIEVDVVAAEHTIDGLVAALRDSSRS